MHSQERTFDTVALTEDMEQPNAAHRFGLRLAALGLSAVTPLGMASCAESPDLAKFASYSNPAVANEDFKGKDWVVCDREALKTDGIVAAKRCLIAQRTGEVALVVFDMEQDRANELADGLEQVINETAGGVLNLSVEAVPASGAAMAELRKIGADGCAAVGDGEHLSVAAEAVMPETLGTYDFVVAMSSVPACGTLPDGSAQDGFALHSGRYADVLISTIDSKYDDEPRANKRAAQVAGHELGHLLKLGHAGSVWRPLPGDRQISISNIPANEPIDLNRHMENAIYLEYGRPDDLMGNSWDVDMNAVHRNTLNWPEKYLYGEHRSISRDKKVTIAGTDIAAEEALGGYYGQLLLLKPVILRSETTGSLKIFDKLALLPQVSETSSGQTVRDVELLLVQSDSNDVASLGYLNLSEDEANRSRTLNLDGRELMVNLQEDGIRMRFVAD